MPNENEMIVADDNQSSNPRDDGGSDVCAQEEVSISKGEDDEVSEPPIEAPAVEGQLPEKKKKSLKGSRINKVLASKLFEAINKEHGTSLIRRASEHHAAVTHCIPTGSFILDLVLDGGFRVGGIHTVWGPKSSGKTSTLLKTIGNAQRMCANCWTLHDPKCACGKYREVVVAYLNIEGTWDGKWAESLGVDLDRLLLSEPDSAELALDVGESLLRSGDVDIIALDSLAFLTPGKEIAESTAKETMGIQSRLLGKGVRKFVAALNRAGNKTGRKPTLFFTNQVRFKLGLVFGNPETQPGGQAPQFAATTEIKFKTPKYEYITETEENTMSDLSSKRPIWVDFTFHSEKSKQSNPHSEGTYRVLLANTDSRSKGDVVDETVLMEFAEKYEIIKKVKSVWDCAGTPFKTKKELEEQLVKDPAFKHLLSRRVIELVLAG